MSDDLGLWPHAYLIMIHVSSIICEETIFTSYATDGPPVLKIFFGSI